MGGGGKGEGHGVCNDHPPAILSVCVPAALCSKRLGPLKSNLIPDEELPAPANHLFNSDELYVDYVEGKWLEVEYCQGSRCYGWKPVFDRRAGKWVVNMPALGDWTLNVRYQHTSDAPSFRIIVQGLCVRTCVCGLAVGDGTVCFRFALGRGFVVFGVGGGGVQSKGCCVLGRGSMWRPSPCSLFARCTQSSFFPRPCWRSLVWVQYLPTLPTT